jgi:hypothetical protein
MSLDIPPIDRIFFFMKRPQTFLYYGGTWTINYFDRKTDCLGQTFSDKQMIDIFTVDIPEETIRETLQHELLHVVMCDVINTLHGTTKSPSDIEEDIIRLVSPRLNALYKQNPHIIEYLYGTSKRKV